MPQPPAFTRLHDYTQNALDNPEAPYNPAHHDAETDAIANSIAGIRTNLAILQRDDGQLGNNTVGPDSLTAATKLLFQDGMTPRGFWATATAYALRDIVEEAGASYICAEAHTSGTFVTDKAAGKWVTLNSTAAVAAANVSVAPSGALSSTTVQSALSELQGDITGHDAQIAALQAADSAMQSDITDATNEVAQFGVAIAAPMRNRIANGEMLLDQFAPGAFTPTSGSGIILDRWSRLLAQASKLTFQRRSDTSGLALTDGGHRSHLRVQVASSYTPISTDYFVVQQAIEGYNVADLLYGTAAAKQVVLSFWVKASATGTYAGSLNDGSGRSYCFTYAIAAANVWERKSIVIAGDTSGSWAGSMTSGNGLFVNFSLGCGSNYNGSASWQSGTLYHASGAVNLVAQTNGSSWDLTGVQLELGSQATEFERRESTVDELIVRRSIDEITAPHRNRIINGCFSIDQRNFGAAQNITATAVYCLDRWAVRSTSSESGTLTAQQQSGSSSGDPRKFIRLARTSGSYAGALEINQVIEASNAYGLAGRQCIVTLRARRGASYNAGLSCTVVSGTTADEGLASGIAGTWANLSNTTGISGPTLTTSWQTFAFAVTLAANVREVMLTISTGNFSSSGGAGDYLEIADVQMYAGNAVLPFEARLPAEEQRLCERYYQKSYHSEVVPGTSTEAGAVYWTAASASSDCYGVACRFATRMRIAPSVFLFSTTGASGNVRNLTGAANVAATAQNIGDGGFTRVGRGSGNWTDGDTAAFHWTASAEL